MSEIIPLVSLMVQRTLHFRGQGATAPPAGDDVPPGAPRPSRGDPDIAVWSAGSSPRRGVMGATGVHDGGCAMDDRRFDSLIKRLAVGETGRREVLKAAAAGALGLA